MMCGVAASLRRRVLHGGGLLGACGFLVSLSARDCASVVTLWQEKVVSRGVVASTMLISQSNWSGLECLPALMTQSNRVL